MNNKEKELREKRAPLLRKLNEIKKNNIKTEELDEVLLELRTLESDIKSCSNKNNRESALIMSNKKQELYEEFLRGKISSAEYRESTANKVGDNPVAHALIEKHMSDGIVERLRNVSDVYDRAEKITNVSGVLSVSREQKGQPLGAKIYAENEEIKQSQVILDERLVTAKRVGARTELTQELVKSTEFNVLDWLSNYIVKDTKALLEKSIFLGGKDKDSKVAFDGILEDKDIVRVEYETAITTDTIIDMVSEGQGSVIDPVLYASPAQYKAIGKLQDGDGSRLMYNDVIDDKGTVGRAIMGIPVIKVDALADAPDGQELVLAGRGGYVILERDGFKVTPKENYAKGVITYFVETHVGGTVRDPQSFVIAKLKAGK